VHRNHEVWRVMTHSFARDAPNLASSHGTRAHRIVEQDQHEHPVPWSDSLCGLASSGCKGHDAGLLKTILSQFGKVVGADGSLTFHYDIRRLRCSPPHMHGV
jgi:hypothetical protein